ncbi:hypothetical protein [Citricoccus sp. GCM10030269]|uniref:hypothetical protein n=1 Tax=Citricoccus sp. GCM10030269 TaxID=3273388 RepID=UPI0036185C3A
MSSSKPTGGVAGNTTPAQTGLVAPAGWTSGSAPGADMLIMPLSGPDRTSPVFTARRWGETPLGGTLHDPRTDSMPTSPRFGAPHGPAPERGLPVSMDRWSGGEWFGLRFLRLAPSMTGQPLAEIRWLLWPVEAATQPLDLDHDAPALDVTATLAVADLTLMEPVLDSLATDIPAGWSPSLPSDAAGRQETAEIRIEPLDSTPPPSGRQRTTSSGAWAGTSLLELTPEALQYLRDPHHDVGGVLPQHRAAQAVVTAGLADASGERLTERAMLAASVLQQPDQVSTLTIHTHHGRHLALELYRVAGLVAAVVHARPVRGLPDAPLFGLYPTERSVELVLRAAALGPSDSRVLEPDTVPNDLLLRRTLEPETALTSDLAESPRWRDLWSEQWLLWRLDTVRYAAGEHPANDAGTTDPPLIALNSGSTGNHLILQSRPQDNGTGQGGETGPDTGPDTENSVRLQPVQTSALLSLLLDRLAGAQPERPEITTE